MLIIQYKGFHCSIFTHIQGYTVIMVTPAMAPLSMFPSTSLIVIVFPCHAFHSIFYIEEKKHDSYLSLWNSFDFIGSIVPSIFLKTTIPFIYSSIKLPCVSILCHLSLILWLFTRLSPSFSYSACCHKYDSAKIAVVTQLWHFGVKCVTITIHEMKTFQNYNSGFTGLDTFQAYHQYIFLLHPPSSVVFLLSVVFLMIALPTPNHEVPLILIINRWFGGHRSLREQKIFVVVVLI